jgi:hypothetical protein
MAAINNINQYAKMAHGIAARRLVNKGKDDGVTPSVNWMNNSKKAASKNMNVVAVAPQSGKAVPAEKNKAGVKRDPVSRAKAAKQLQSLNNHFKKMDDMIKDFFK